MLVYLSVIEVCLVLSDGASSDSGLPDAIVGWRLSVPTVERPRRTVFELIDSGSF